MHKITITYFETSMIIAAELGQDDHPDRYDDNNPYFSHASVALFYNPEYDTWQTRSGSWCSWGKYGSRMVKIVYRTMDRELTRRGYRKLNSSNGLIYGRYGHNMIRITRQGKTVGRSQNLRGILDYSRKHGIDRVYIYRNTRGAMLQFVFGDNARAWAKFEDFSIAVSWVKQRRSWGVKPIIVE